MTAPDQEPIDLVDALNSGRINRREFMRRGMLLGLSIPTLAAVLAACGDDDDDDDAEPTEPAAMQTIAPTDEPEATEPAGEATPAADELGSTPGWGGGQVATVFYTKDFFCDADPCQAGAAGANAPGTTDPVPSVWVLVPLFDDIEGIAFHCPTAGNCIAHPDQIDVSAIGLGEVIPIPPHSHIVDPAEPGFSAAGETPWKVVVVGVNTRAAWDMLEAGKSIETLRQVQADEANATADIPTNIVLFFGIR
jgi:hypothetical protein